MTHTCNRFLTKPIQLTFLLVAIFTVSNLHGHDHPGYYHGDFLSNGQAGNNKNWMAGIPGTRTISELSVPGTHETMAKYGGDAVECQSMTLNQQLSSGIRALDIRCRHTGSLFLIYHSFVPQNAGFGTDVLEVCKQFLIANPSETIFMRVKKEGEGNGVLDPDPVGTFAEVFESYRTRYSEYIWTNTGTNNPTLDDVRGKIVVLRQSFSSTAGIPYTFSAPEGQLDGPKAGQNPYLQDRYKMSTNWDLYDKWENVRNHLNTAAAGGKNDLYMNFLSASGGSFPYFVASGHFTHFTDAPRLATGRTTPGWSSWGDFPRVACAPLIDILCLGLCDAPDVCTIAFEGTNILTTNYINAGGVNGRVGMIMADYPGKGLIEAIISLNKARLVTNTNDSGEGSLRWAIGYSSPFDPNKSTEFSGGSISFAPELSGKTILLNSEIVIDRDIEISASRLPKGITLSGGGKNRIFKILQADAFVRLSGLTISNGNAGTVAGDGITGWGSGVYSLAQGLEISGCTFTDNVADIGSAIGLNRLVGRLTGANCNVSNSTIAGNTAKQFAGIALRGGGNLTIDHCTISGNKNQSNTAGAGISIETGSVLRLSNSIVSGNSNQSIMVDIDGSFTAPAPNIVGRQDFGTVTGTIPLTSNPLLGPLADNGGPTWTMRPSGFPGSAVWGGRLNKDQRGEKRPARAGTPPILGAVEILPGPDIKVFSSVYPTKSGEILNIGHALPGSGQHPFALITIKNRGNVELKDLALDFHGIDVDQFSITALPSTALASQTEVALNVVFNPTSEGKKYAHLNIASNDPDQSPYGLYFEATGDFTYQTDGSTGGTLTQKRSPTWNRPDDGAAPDTLSPTANATSFSVGSFTVAEPGYYTLTSTTRSSNWDNNLFLYHSAFDAASGLTNVLGGSTEKNAFDLIQYSAALQPSIRYYAVTTGATNSDAGDHTLKITGPGKIVGFAPPTNVLPSQSGTEVSAYPTFSWTTTPEATYELFLGTTPENLVSIGYHTSPYTPTAPLGHGVTYYWRLDSHLSGSVLSSGAQNFTTTDSIEVTTDLDENDGALGLGTGDSLREAIAFAATGDSQTIKFARSLSGHTITLGGTPLTISSDLAIDGSPLPSVVTISGANASRVFNISSGANVSMNAITIANGQVADGVHGAGIYNEGTLFLYDTAVSANRAHTGNGGGIYNLGALTIEKSTLSVNDAQHGGAIYNDGAAAISKLTNTTISGNTTTSGGGGIANANEAGLTLIHNTIAGNFTSAGRGAGIELISGTLHIENSIIAGNDALNGRPSIYKIAGTLTKGGVSIIGDNTSVSTEFPSSSFVGTSSSRILPKLSPLDLYGGRTQTKPPLPGSSAFDEAVATAQSPSQDQRGTSRPRGSGYDIGAIESLLSANADLSSLGISSGKVDPVFYSDVTEYVLAVAATLESMRVRVSTESFAATVNVRANDAPYVALIAGEASAELPLNPGQNQIDVKVTAENGTDKLYSIAVQRGAPPATNTDLDSLTLGSGTLLPSFISGVSSYDATVGNATASVTVTPILTETNASIDVAINSGNRASLASGAASASLPLNVGANRVEITVTSADGSATGIHTIRVYREAAAAADANLSGLTTSAGALSPAFAQQDYFYKAKVSEDTTSITITPTASQPSTTLTVKSGDNASTQIASGATSANLPLEKGTNQFQIEITSADTTALAVYTVIIERAGHDLEKTTNDPLQSQPNNNSKSVSISADGRFVAFSSRATNLVDSDTNNKDDIFVYDRMTDTVERVSVSNAGVQGNFESTYPSISADGRFVAFQSESDNLVPNDSNGQTNRSAGQDIFVYDRANHTIERVSLRDNGGQSNQASERPSISADGRFVAFSSGANNLVSGFVNDNVNVYVYDRDNNSIVGIKVPFADFRTNRDSLHPAISADGNFVAFEFWVDRNDDNQNYSYQYTDIYVYNRVTQAVERITGNYEGRDAILDKSNAPYGDRSSAPSISADGRFVAYQSTSDQIDFDDTNNSIDVFVHDRLDGSDRRLSTNGTGQDELYRDSINPAISGNGQYVVFESRVSNFVSPDTNDMTDIFRVELATGDFSIMSVDSEGAESDNDSTFPSLSYDGNFVAFESRATNLVPSDTNGNVDIFVAVNGAFSSSTVADLKPIASNLGALAFSNNGTTIALSVPQTLDQAFIAPLSADPNAKIEYQYNSGGFTPVDSTTQTAAVPLALGVNTIQFRVTAADDSTTKTYSVEVTRARSDDASLASLVFNDESPDGTSPIAPTTPFRSGVTEYSVGVANSISAISVTPSVAQAGASVTVKGTAVASGTPSSAISLSIGSNPITIVVTAEDGTATKSYLVTVYRNGSSDAELVSIAPSIGTLSPTFSSETSDYAISVPSGTTTATLTPTASDSNAKISVNGKTVASGAASTPMPIYPGANILYVQTTAQDGVTTKSYTLTLTVKSEVPAPAAVQFTNIQLLAGPPYKLQVTWASESGLVYRLEYSTNLTDWQPVAGDFPSAGTSTTTEIDLPEPPSSRLFLRVSIKP